jgi:ABC-type Fe3+-siderophore transport system permease subunit
MVGAGAVLAMVAGASWKGGHISGRPASAHGISLNSICSAFILLIYGVVRERRSFSITQWLLGSVDSVSYTPHSASSPSRWRCPAPSCCVKLVPGTSSRLETWARPAASICSA